MARPNESITIWQWNCRGYNRKRPNLQMLLSKTLEAPLVIALQEPGLDVKLLGYQAFQCPYNSYTATLVYRNIPAECMHFDSIEIPHDLVVLYPPERTALQGTKCTKKHLTAQDFVSVIFFSATVCHMYIIITRQLNCSCILTPSDVTASRERQKLRY